MVLWAACAEPGGSLPHCLWQSNLPGLNWGGIPCTTLVAEPNWTKLFSSLESFLVTQPFVGRTSLHWTPAFMFSHSKCCPILGKLPLACSAEKWVGPSESSQGFIKFGHPLNVKMFSKFFSLKISNFHCVELSEDTARVNWDSSRGYFWLPTFLNGTQFKTRISSGC